MTVTVLAHGCWDGLHIGHIRHLQQARTLGDRLIVGVTADEYVAKGPNRPRYKLADRIEALRALRFVDEVIAVHEPDPCETIRFLRPDVYVKGAEYAGKEIPERAAVESIGGRLEFLGETLGSSSAAINAEVPQHAFLASCRKQYSVKDVEAALDAMRAIDVTVIGDAIQDVYVPAELQGLTAKGGAPSLRFTGEPQRFPGGMLALVNHASALGGRPIGAMMASSQTTKRRYYSMAGGQLRVLAAVEDIADPVRLTTPVPREYFGSKLVIVGDYGHGSVDAHTLALINAHGGCAVTCQTNSANYGLNVLTQRYNAVGLFVVDDREMKLALHTAEPERGAINTLQVRLGAERAYWTRGERATLSTDGYGGFIRECPALESRPLDPLGAGDAFFVVAALCWAAKVPEALSLLLAQIAGAQLTRVLGNSKPLDVEALKRTAAAILA